MSKISTANSSKPIPYMPVSRNSLWHSKVQGEEVHKIQPSPANTPGTAGCICLHTAARMDGTAWATRPRSFSSRVCPNMNGSAAFCFLFLFGGGCHGKDWFFSQNKPRKIKPDNWLKIWDYLTITCLLAFDLGNIGFRWKISFVFWIFRWGLGTKPGAIFSLLIFHREPPRRGFTALLGKITLYLLIFLLLIFSELILREKNQSCEGC